MSEAEFYEHFASFDSLENQIMLNYFTAAVEEVEIKAGYTVGTAREKIKAFFLAWVNILKQNRSLIVILNKQSVSKLGITQPMMDSLKKEFRLFTDKILLQAEASKEIENRKMISDRYADGLWLQLLFIYRFWLKDESKGFEKTNEAIDKSVDLSFDLMAKTSLDTALDLGKFLFNNFKI